MTYWDKIANQNKLDTNLLTQLSDISYKSTGGRREQPRGLKDGIVDIGKLPFEITPPKNAITKAKS